MTPGEMSNHFKKAFALVPFDLRDAAQDAMFVFSNALFALDERWGELGTEARVAWLNTMTNAFIRTPEGMRDTLGSINSIVGFLDNWSDCVTSQKWRDHYDATDGDIDMTLIVAANKAGEAARAALHAVVDHVRIETLKEAP